MNVSSLHHQSSPSPLAPTISEDSGLRAPPPLNTSVGLEIFDG